MNSSLLSISVCFLIFLNFIEAQRTELEANILKGVLENYDKNVLPSPIDNSSATINRVNIYVRSIKKLSSKNHEFTVQLTFRMQYNDSRLAFNDSVPYIQFSDANLIWTPDLFFSNELDSKEFNLFKPNVLFRIYPNGEVLYSKRLAADFSCPMNLKYFPFDSQVCQIKIGSYGYTTNELIILWKSYNPIQITSSLYLPDFRLVQTITDYCTSKTNTGEYSCIFASLEFERETSYYFFKLFIPSIILVFLSWLSFWIDADDQLIIKFALNLFSLFNLIILSLFLIYLDDQYPNVSYLKAIDLWLSICFVFILLALIESIIVYRRQINKTTNHSSTTDDRQETTDRPNDKLKLFLNFLFHPKSDKIDCIFRLLFIILFIIFLILYFGLLS